MNQIDFGGPAAPGSARFRMQEAATQLEGMIRISPFDEMQFLQGIVYPVVGLAQHACAFAERVDALAKRINSAAERCNK